MDSSSLGHRKSVQRFRSSRRCWTLGAHRGGLRQNIGETPCIWYGAHSPSVVGPVGRRAYPECAGLRRIDALQLGHANNATPGLVRRAATPVPEPEAVLNENAHPLHLAAGIQPGAVRGTAGCRRRPETRDPSGWTPPASSGGVRQAQRFVTCSGRRADLEERHDGGTDAFATWRRCTADSGFLPRSWTPEPTLEARVRAYRAPHLAPANRDSSSCRDASDAGAELETRG